MLTRLPWLGSLLLPQPLQGDARGRAGGTTDSSLQCACVCVCTLTQRGRAA